MWYEFFIDRNIIPDSITRRIIRFFLRRYSKRVSRLSSDQLTAIQKQFVDNCCRDKVAIHADLANMQHYEFPTKFYQYVLGNTMKYSCSYWEDSSLEIDDVDRKTLDIYAERSGIKDGENILELGTGWGAFSLHLASKFTQSTITTVTNSETQYQYVSERVELSRLSNVRVVKDDVNTFNPNDSFDCIISIEMFEHMRNSATLFGKIHEWLVPGGRLFIQVFSHMKYPQFFDDMKDSWMARNFFAGGMMPYDGFYSDISGKFKFLNKWKESGVNYHRTLEYWLSSLDYNRPSILQTISKGSKGDHLDRRINRFRLFLMYCSELFKFNSGKEWYVLNYLFQK